MPITPLHLGLMAPYLYYARIRANAWTALLSFTLVNLWIDSQAIYAWFTSQSLPSHDEAHHTIVGALMVAVCVSVPGILMRTREAWALGAFTGALSHIFLDALVHPDMHPFDPVMRGNPLYIDGMAPVSLTLVPLTGWLIAECVSSALGYVRKRRELARLEQHRHSS